MNVNKLRACPALHFRTRQNIRSSNAGLFFISLLLLLTASAGCGSHKTKIKVPKSGTAAKSSPSKTAPSKAAPPVKEPRKTESSASRSDAKGTVSSEPDIPAAPTMTEAGPLMRIGLQTDAKEFQISSSDDFFVQEKVPETKQKKVRGKISVRLEREAEDPASVYKIQLASFSRQEKAQDFLDEITDRFTIPLAVYENPSSGAWQVRAGAFTSRNEAQDYLAELKKDGYPDAFLVREETAAGSGQWMIAIRGEDDVFMLSRTGFLFLPSSPKAFLCVDGKPYRGSLDLFINRKGRITLVNRVALEDYLLGVVPAEMSPSHFPEFDALAAQSIAARTYALKNMGRFRTDGFDLSDDTRTQVYEGVSMEKPMTTDIVRRTAGQAIYYQGQLIDAMFMSTCGGHTEDFANVYDARPVPYLKGVRCSIESGSGKGELTIEGKHELTEPFIADDGSLANRNIELARKIQLIPSDASITADSLSEPIQPDEIVLWIKNAAGMISRRTAHGEKVRAVRAGFLLYAVESIFGVDDIKRKISSADVDYYMASLKDGAQIPQELRAPLSYLMQKGLWRPDAENAAKLDAPMRRGDAIALIMRWIEDAKPEILRKGAFSEAGDADALDKSALQIKWGNKTKTFALAGHAALFRLDPGRSVPIDTIKLIGTEKAAFHLDEDGRIDFLEIELSATGASSDRYSSSATWETTISRSALAEKLKNLAGNIGELKDLAPHRLGVSGRVVQLQAVGSRKSAVLNGNRVRGALNLRDTLYTLTRRFNPDGSIASFTFSGRGFGHGVGLCQVGAYGMAKAGRTYEEILKTYYQGVEIKKAY